MARNRKASDEPASELRSGARIGAVVSTFHADLTRAMLASACGVLVGAGLAEEDLLVVEVAGSFELPLVARRLAIRDDVDAVLCFGLVLKGETTHDVYIAHATSQGLLDVSLQTDKPVLFGVLTCDTLEQARARALPPEDGGEHDKGAEVARAAIAALAALERTGSIGLKASSMGFAPAGADGAGGSGGDAKR